MEALTNDQVSAPRPKSATAAIQGARGALMRSCIIFNPAARGEKAKRFRKHLDEIGTQATLKLTTARGDGRRLATEAVAEGFETIVAAGGDGTVNEVLNGLTDAPDGVARARLAVLPLGTINVFARELGIPQNLMLAWQTIRKGRETHIDLPFVDFLENGTKQRRYFAQLAGAGLDARAVELAAWELKKKVGLFAYVFAGLKALSGTQAEICVETENRRVTGCLVLIGNGRLYGGNFRIFPDADLRDGAMDLCVFPRVSWFTLARCGPSLLLSGRLPASQVVMFQAKQVRLSANTRIPAEIDGEFLGPLPVQFAMSGNRLRVVVP